MQTVRDKTQFVCVRTDQEWALAPEPFWWKRGIRELESTSNTKMLTFSLRKLQKYDHFESSQSSDTTMIFGFKQYQLDYFQKQCEVTFATHFISIM